MLVLDSFSELLYCEAAGQLYNPFPLAFFQVVNFTVFIKVTRNIKKLLAA